MDRRIAVGHLIRVVGILSCLAIMGQAVWLNRVTGGRAWTTYPTTGLARMKQFEGATDAVFHDEGLDAGTPRPDPIDNDFHFGWLPSGAGREAISVTSVSFPAVVAIVAIGICGGTRRGRARPEMRAA